MRKLKAGDIAPVTAFYIVCNQRGVQLDAIKVIEGEVLPPLKSKYFYYELYGEEFLKDRQ